MENFIIANCTDTGRTRNVNEDSMTTFDSPNGRVVAVCDGMGGQNAGDVASSLAVTVIQDILTDNTFASPEEAINRSIFAANQAILRRAAQDVNLSGMGSTCVMIIIKDGQVYYGSVGDSRIYYIAGASIRQITKDQSYVQTLVDEGTITQEAAEHHQDKNQITNALGLEGMTAPVIGQMPITPEPGSVFLLCSDGLSGMINNNTILSTVSNSQVPLPDRAQQLVNLANAAGGFDNITVQLVEFTGNGRSQSIAIPKSGNSGGAYIPKKRKSRIPLYSAIVFLLLVIIGGVGAYMYLQEPNAKAAIPRSTIKEKKKETTVKEAPKETIVVKETIVKQEAEKTPKAKTERNYKSVENLMEKKLGNKKKKNDEESDDEKLIIKESNYSVEKE